MLALARARNVRLMGFDVDGVLTGGGLHFSADGDVMKAFNSRDGLGMKLLATGGIRLAIITGRKSALVERRAENLGIDLIFQGVEDKRAVMAELLASEGLDFAQAGYMGDDVVDLAVMAACGFAATVPDGHPLVKQRAHYVARAPAGGGAAREVCELILRAQGKLDIALAPHQPPA
ncbi:MAG: phenylphosphate carboxylase subunit delta [Gammaproteobacteria bacterium]|nr:phenylphosphate carboxylase subunit delta [Gammaproteobacteria bacterium]MBU1646974.1 phenylphosphate carboxylase subunit delta [Gammaproteobacteria bacterium]MBU1972486.1 phenylphosphate carboxylase subunit delta [Gammaproteobacteria bacterium]